MIKRIEHLGLAVKSVPESEKLFEKLLGTAAYKREKVASEKVETSFFKVGESKVELLGAVNEEGVIQKYIDKRGEGLHHVAFYAENLEQEIIRLKGEGFYFINEEPKSGADGKKIVFLHPKCTNGLLVELCEDK